jgi:hypothetical protein
MYGKGTFEKEHKDPPHCPATPQPHCIVWFH